VQLITCAGLAAAQQGAHLTVFPHSQRIPWQLVTWDLSTAVLRHFVDCK